MREYRSVLERAIKQEEDELSTSEEETTEDDPTSNEDSSTSDAQEEDDTTSEEASTVTSEEMRDELDNFGLEGTKKELVSHLRWIAENCPARPDGNEEK